MNSNKLTNFHTSRAQAFLIIVLRVPILSCLPVLCFILIMSFKVLFSFCLQCKSTAMLNHRLFTFSQLTEFYPFRSKINRLSHILFADNTKKSQRPIWVYTTSSSKLTIISEILFRNAWLFNYILIFLQHLQHKACSTADTI